MTLGPAVPNALVESNLRYLRFPLVSACLISHPGARVRLQSDVRHQHARQPDGVVDQRHRLHLAVVPTLVKILDGASTDADFNQTENMFVFPANKALRLSNAAYSPANALHPFHLHGNNFWVVQSNATDIINTVNPIRRDVAGTASRGMILRFTTDKPGPLPPNCHIFYHFVTGLGSVIVGGPDEILQQVHPIEGWDALCPAYNALPPDEQRCNRASMRE
ncbi:Cupredoxin [Mycena metata]|uniref:Cupredoxin n=1 Tax=Mycena metata TaxID=1033252 RepID=A0AAD7JC94_9AGAR|nr:Cupredoxin [Mycena metata]